MAPLRMTTGMTTAGGCPSPRSFAHRIPVNAMTDPTDKSIPPVRMTQVIPTARISR